MANRARYRLCGAAGPGPYNGARQRFEWAAAIAAAYLPYGPDYPTVAALRANYSQKLRELEANCSFAGSAVSRTPNGVPRKPNADRCAPQGERLAGKSRPRTRDCRNCLGGSVPTGHGTGGYGHPGWDRRPKCAPPGVGPGSAHRRSERSTV